MTLPYIKGITKKTLAKWTKKEWYHQGFDGSPYFMHLIAEAEMMREPGKKDWGENLVHYCFFEGGKADWYILMDDIKEISSHLIQFAKK